MNQTTRLWICVLIALGLLWIAVPRLPVEGTAMAFGFSLLWLAFCLLVIAANLYALLRLGRGQVTQRPGLAKEQRQALAKIHRHRRRRVPSN